MIHIRLIDREHQADINIPNEPFQLFGRMIPACANGKWTYTTERFPTVTTMRFPDENYEYDKMQSDYTFIGAYDGEKCVGLAIMQGDLFKFMYLYDLKVNASWRRKGIARLLIQKAMEVARQQGYIGIYTRGQDNNLGACLFYLKMGFEIGGFDNRIYEGTSQADKADILFYKK